MIVSFADKRSELVWKRDYVKNLSEETCKMAFRKLTMLDKARTLGDIAAVPGNRLEKLAGNRQGQYSIRINNQWRICFEWSVKGASNVEIVDYH